MPLKSSPPLNRRSFIQKSAVASLAFPAILKGAEAGAPPAKTAVIGCGWYGMVVLKAARQAGNVECVAVCDVDSAHLEKFADETATLQGSRPRSFKHYQELLEAVDFDFLILATPPQWHALPFIAACRKGVDIYCEKPLAYDVREGRAMVDAARRAGNVVQVGFQRRQNASVKDARDFIRGGDAGEIVQVDAQIHYGANLKSAAPEEPPASLDWDLWCGPAPKLPYSPNIGHFLWRLEKEYGNGHLVDWGIHWIDSIRHTLGETTPRNIQAAGGIYHLKGQITTPDTLSAHFDFASCPVHWRHRLWGAQEVDPENRNCAIYYGTKATVKVTDRGWTVIPVGKNTSPVVHHPQNPAGAGVQHMADFLAARREGRPPACTVEDGYRSTATVQLGMIAYDARQAIQWDERNERIIDNPEAHAMLKREYRTPWRHPF